MHFVVLKLILLFLNACFLYETMHFSNEQQMHSFLYETMHSVVLNETMHFVF